MITKISKYGLLMLIILALFELFSCGGGGGDDSTFSIQYDSNGSTSGTVPTKQSSDGDSSLLVSGNSGNLSKDGYIFDGWNTTPDGNGTNYAEGASYSGKSITLYAKWAAIFFTSPDQQNIPSLTEGKSYAPGNSNLVITGLTEKGKKLSEIVVPNLIDGCNVTRIKGNAFEGCINITSFTFAVSITKIGQEIFSGCLNLKKIFFLGTSPPEITPWTFDGCTAKIYVSSAYIDIYTGATNWDGYISRITVADTEIFTYTVLNNSVTITGLTTYGKTMTSIEIPESIENHPVTSIGSWAFWGCNGTGALVIPSSIRTIGYNAFRGTDFTSLTIENGIIDIGPSAFSDCTCFTGELIIPSSVRNIGELAFAGCSNFSSLSIENGVTNIGTAAFAQCTGFSGNLTIPGSVITIGETSNENITGAFFECTGFTSLTIENGITFIGDNTFWGCTGFTGNLTIPRTVTTIGSGAFARCTGFTGELTIPSSVREILGTNQYEGAFSGGLKFSTLTIENGLTHIGFDAFRGLKATGDLTIPDSVTTIEGQAFCGCTGLTGTVTISNGVSVIGRWAFNGCTGITGLIIPSSVTKIEEKAFVMLTNLITMRVENPTPPTLEGEVFNNLTSLDKIYVPQASLSTYKSKWPYSSKMVGY